MTSIGAIGAMPMSLLSVLNHAVEISTQPELQHRSSTRSPPSSVASLYMRASCQPAYPSDPSPCNSTGAQGRVDDGVRRPGALPGMVFFVEGYDDDRATPGGFETSDYGRGKPPDRRDAQPRARLEAEGLGAVVRPGPVTEASAPRRSGSRSPRTRDWRPA